MLTNANKGCEMVVDAIEGRRRVASTKGTNTVHRGMTQNERELENAQKIAQISSLFFCLLYRGSLYEGEVRGS